jgi:Lon protease-like protein
MSRVLPIFPLGSVVLPGAGLPLHIFEDRYRVLMEHLTTGRFDPAEFGVLLIERGSEVGGGEQRSEMGTIVALLGYERLPDGRWVIVAGGGSRFRVRSWLADDPYPRADIEIVDDAPWDPSDDDVLDEAERHVRRCVSLATELEVTDAPVGFRRLDDPVEAVWQLAALAPLGSYDRQTLLEATDPSARVRLLARLAAETADTLAFRLGGD